MELAANDFEWQVKQAEATLADLKVQLQSKTVRSAVGGREHAERPGAGRASQRNAKSSSVKLQLESDLEREAFRGEVGAVWRTSTRWKSRSWTS